MSVGGGRESEKGEIKRGLNVKNQKAEIFIEENKKSKRVKYNAKRAWSRL
jgi:hypothetical protein